MRCVIGITAVLVWATSATALINPEDFSSPGYVPGNALSDWYFQPFVGSTTAGALDISGNPDPGEREVTLTVNSDEGNIGAVAARASGWGGPGRPGGGPGALWYAVDIRKGSADAQTSLTDNLWYLDFNRQNSSQVLTFRGGLSTVEVKNDQAGSPPWTTGLITLEDLPAAGGWNRVVVVNDNSTSPNIEVYLNGNLVYTNTVTGATGASNTTSTYFVALGRYDRTGDHMIGSMQFDNIITANEPLDFISPRIPEPATLMLLALGVLPVLRRRRCPR